MVYEILTPAFKFIEHLKVYQASSDHMQCYFKLLVLFLLINGIDVDAQTIENPIISGMNSDPSVCRAGDAYYLTSSSCGYFPGIPIYKSLDLINWTLIGHCITRPQQMNFLNMNINAGLWATTIRYHKGKFYVVSTHMKSNKNFIVTATDPAGPWSDPIYVATEGYTYDPSLFFDADGKTYFNYASGAGTNTIKLQEIDVTTGKLLTAPKDIWWGGGGFGAEGAHIYKIKDYYYIMNAEGGNINQAVVIGRSKSIYGPYELCPRNPIASNKENRQYLLQCTGHGDLIQHTDQSWWLIIHGVRNYGGFDDLHTVLGRESILLPVKWENNWPVVNGNQPITKSIPHKNTNIPKALPRKSFEENFSASKLQLGWYFQRDPANQLWNVDTVNRQLALRGNESDLDSESKKAFIGKKQDFEWGKLSVSWKFDPVASNEEAGITFFMNKKHHFDCFITKAEQGYQLVLRRRVGDINYNQAVVPLPKGEATIEVNTNPWAYEWFMITEKGDRVPLANMQNQGISLQVAGGFVGVTMGMYATGNGKKCQNLAFFKYFRYEESQNLVPLFKK